MYQFPSICSGSSFQNQPKTDKKYPPDKPTFVPLMMWNRYLSHWQHYEMISPYIYKSILPTDGHEQKSFFKQLHFQGQKVLIFFLCPLRKIVLGNTA